LFALSARAALDGIDTETGRSIEAHTFLGWTFSFPRTRLRDAGPDRPRHRRAARVALAPKDRPTRGELHRLLGLLE
jgi:hypothetical protein